jgi:hypothetical protein
LEITSCQQEKKNFCFEVQQLLQQAASSGIGVVGFQSLVFPVFFYSFFIFFDKFCSLPDCWIWKALWYDAMGEVLVLNWKSSWIER